MVGSNYGIFDSQAEPMCFGFSNHVTAVAILIQKRLSKVVDNYLYLFNGSLGSYFPPSNIQVTRERNSLRI
ncbi:MAG: hypothetical protein WA667_13760 [Candidatus Nitrosopolaris sp.]